MVSRRSLIASLALLAGCTGTDGPATDTDGRTETDLATESEEQGDGTADGNSDAENDSSATESTDVTSTSTATSDDLDLREANVMAVEWSGSPGGEIEFSVTLYHDDEGEDGYANWWQVETLDGERLGRRELLHAHGTREFTRSETVDVPADVDCVVVRGHDETHGYGGRAVLASLTSGETATVDQGSEKQSFDETDCP